MRHNWLPLYLVLGVGYKFVISALHQLCMVSVFVPMWHAYSSLYGVILGAGPSNPDGTQFSGGTTVCSVQTVTCPQECFHSLATWLSLPCRVAGPCPAYHLLRCLMECSVLPLLIPTTSPHPAPLAWPSFPGGLVLLSECLLHSSLYSPLF